MHCLICWPGSFRTIPNLVLYISVFALTLSSCAFKQEPQSNTVAIVNRGPIALSPDNPHIEANQFIINESLKDSNLKGFVETQGQPDALELRILSNQPHRLMLYYLEQQQVYECLNSPKGWSIFASKSISKQKLTELATLDALTSRFEFLKSFKKQSIPFSKSKNNRSSTMKDVIHSVKGSNETLLDISKRYTGNKDAAPALARINGFDLKTPLPIGVNIRVPAYLARKNERPKPRFQDLESSPNVSKPTPYFVVPHILKLPEFQKRQLPESADPSYMDNTLDDDDY